MFKSLLKASKISHKSFLNYGDVIDIPDDKYRADFIGNLKNTSPDKLTACVLKRPRHDKIVESLNLLKVKIKFINDGDVSGVIAVADPKSSVDIYLGIGGGPEGVLSASALACLNCQMQTKLFFQNDLMLTLFRCL